MILLCLAVALHDVDTLRCATGERIRLAGIGALELDGRARPHQPSVPGDPFAQRLTMARAVLGAAVASDERGPAGRLWFVRPVALRCTTHGLSYGRTVAACARLDGRDVSCEAIRAGVAKRWPVFDRAGRLRRCGR